MPRELTQTLFRACLIVLCVALTSPAVAQNQADWKPVPGRLMTRWAADVSPDKAHAEYPRPMMARERWQSLNGLWDEVGTMARSPG